MRWSTIATLGFGLAVLTSATVPLILIERSAEAPAAQWYHIESYGEAGHAMVTISRRPSTLGTVTVRRVVVDIDATEDLLRWYALGRSPARWYDAERAPRVVQRLFSDASIPDPAETRKAHTATVFVESGWPCHASTLTFGGAPTKPLEVIDGVEIDGDPTELDALRLPPAIALRFDAAALLVNALTFIAAIAIVWFIARLTFGTARRRWRATRGLCTECGYELIDGAPSCTECGATATWEVRPSVWEV